MCGWALGHSFVASIWTLCTCLALSPTFTTAVRRTKYMFRNLLRMLCGRNLLSMPISMMWLCGEYQLLNGYAFNCACRRVHKTKAHSNTTGSILLRQLLNPLKNVLQCMLPDDFRFECIVSLKCVDLICCQMWPTRLELLHGWRLEDRVRQNSSLFSRLRLPEHQRMQDGVKRSIPHALGELGVTRTRSFPDGSPANEYVSCSYSKNDTVVGLTRRAYTSYAILTGC
jgi:hypothetical protein